MNIEHMVDWIARYVAAIPEDKMSRDLAQRMAASAYGARQDDDVEQPEQIARNDLAPYLRA